MTAPIDYQVEIADLQAHQFRVTLTLPQPSALQRLSLPVWIPGSYLVREFSRHLSGLEARQGKRTVPLQQLDKCTWQAECRGSAPLVVSCLVYAYDASVRTAWLEASRGFFNGTSLFLRCEGHEARAHRVSLPGLPKGWQIATGMRAVGTARRPVFESADYDELIDHPFELGPFWRGTFEACGVPHEFVVAGAWPGFDGDRLIADAKRICEAQIRFWHGESKPPFGRYVFLLNAVDDGYGGLEHRASTALICGRRDLPRKGHAGLTDGYVTLLGLISHEYFHTWNVKRLKPSEFAPYDLTRENTTELLWFFEGFTSYYDDLLLLRAGLIDEARYLKLVAKTVNQVQGTPGRHVQSVAEASFDAWIKYYRPDENSANSTVSYYTKGSLVALALDLRLRAEGRGSLDAVLRRLWETSAPRAELRSTRPPGGSRKVAEPHFLDSAGGPIDEAAIAEALAFVGKRPYDDELQAWVHGTAELPLADLLAPMGVRWTREAPLLQQRLGARVAEAGLKVQVVLHGGAAEAAGLAAGDELVGVDDWRLARLDDLLPLGAFDRPVTLLVARDRRLLRLPFSARVVEGAVSLSADPKPGAAVLRRRAAWLKPVKPA